MVNKVFVIGCILLLSCGSQSQDVHIEVLATPDLGLIKQSGFEVDSSAINYQYYEKFGFGDICENLTLVWKGDIRMNDKTWNQLPISESDLRKINNMDNKTVPLSKSGYVIFREVDTSLKDIWIKSLYYLRDKNNPMNFTLNKGVYKVFKNSFIIYDEESGLCLYEKHVCNK